MTTATDNTAKTIARVTKVSLFSSVVAAILIIATNILNARLYGAEVLGLFALASSPWLLAMAVSNFGENAALIRALAPLPRRSKRTLTLTLATLALSTAWTAVACLAIVGISALFLRTFVTNEDVLGYAVVLTATFVLLVNPSWMLQGLFIVYASARDLLIARLLPVVCFLVSSALIGIANPTLGNLVLAWVGSAVVGLAYALLRMPAFVGGGVSRTGIGEAGREIRGIVSFAARAWPGNLASAFATQAGLWAVAGVAGTVQAGVFSRVLGLQERAADLSIRLQDGLFPAMVRFFEAGDLALLRATWWRTMGPLVGLAAAVLTPLALEADAAMALLGPEFESGANALRWVALASWLLLVLSGLGSILLATNRAGLGSLILIGRSVCILALLYPAVSAYGATGASCVYAVMLAVDGVVRCAILWRVNLLRFASDGRPLSNSFVCAISAAAVTVVAGAVLGGTVGGELVAMSLGIGGGLLAWAILRRLNTWGRAGVAVPVAGATVRECPYPPTAKSGGAET